MKLGRLAYGLLCFITSVAFLSVTAGAGPAVPLKRPVPKKPVYKEVPANENSNTIVFKLTDEAGAYDFDGGRFNRSGNQWNRLNAVVSSGNKALTVAPRFSVDRGTLAQMRDVGSARVGYQLPDLSRYHELRLPASASPAERLAKVNELNSLDIVEIAYFAPKPSPAAYLGSVANPVQLMVAAAQSAPNWEPNQYYLQAAPTGIDAYYAWNTPGGKGDGVKVIDIEGNWIETHEDLHGGTDSWHIAGARINDPGWYNHGTAVLGEIAADSNGWGMTGIAFNVDLGTVSIGSMSTASALITATENSDTGDVILIELHAPGPHYNFEARDDQMGYVPMEYWQENFDAILQASALGRIVVEAGGNGRENLDDTNIYGQLFNPEYRFSGAIMVGASYNDHSPAPFTNYGQRVDVHAFGTWDVYTLGYGDLYGSTPSNYYTHSFAGTSSASPIIVGACASLQGVHLATHGRVLNHDAMRALLIDYSTPQAPSSKNIGPLPDLAGSVDAVVGVSFFADTTFGWAPLDVSFSASSGLPVDSWTWDFGDGDSAFVQAPQHAFQSAGMYSVTVQIESGGEFRTAQRLDYIIALADTLAAPGASAMAGETVELVINANNTIPVRSMLIPFEYPGDLQLEYDSFSTEGCRTDYFEYQQLILNDFNGRRAALRLTSSNSGTAPHLTPGDGPVVKLYFSLGAGALYGQEATVELDGFSSYLPNFSGASLDYQPGSTVGTITVCIERGNVDGIAGITVNDLTYLVNYLFKSGLPPFPADAADPNCSGTVNVTDLTFLVDYLFKGGPPPCGC